MRIAIGGVLLRSAPQTEFVRNENGESHADPTIENQSRKNFIRLHEVSHDLFPWQSELAYADDDAQLSPATSNLFERQANQGAAHLFFQGDRFTAMANDYAIGFGAVADLANTVGSSLRATLRQFAETHHGAVCGLVLEPSPVGGDVVAYRRYEVSQSCGWIHRFGHAWPQILTADCFRFLDLIGNPAAEMGVDVNWPDIAGNPVSIRAAIMRNRFSVMVLLWVPRRETFKRRRILERAV